MVSVMKTVDFIFDFGSPNAYLAHKVIPDVEARTGARFRYVPCLLGGVFKATGNQSPVMAFANVQAKLTYESLEMQRFIAKHRIPFTMNPYFPVNTLTIMRGAIAADTEGVFEDYVDAVMDSMWAESKKMDEPEVILDALGAAGLSGARLLERAQAPEVKAKLIANTQEAVARGVFGAPSFFIGDEMWFGKDKLRDVEEALVA
ncbi:MAG: 2-hydroxychromene-2-carboxylate isomerase [Amphiplicatus sp.]